MIQYLESAIRENHSQCKEDKSNDYLVECARYQFRADDLFPPT